MTWLTWRQFRTQAVVAGAGLAVVAIYLLVLGYRMRHAYTTDILGCVPANCATAKRAFTDAYDGVQLAGMLLLGVPGLIGVFWGAPLVAREFEEKTDRLVWNQSVTRTRWLAVKLAVLALVSVAVTGLFSLALTWGASRYDLLAGERFGATNFAARNIVPLGYAAFAFVLGTVAGMLVRRTVVAMALTLAVFAAIQVFVPTMLRAHLMPPVTSTVPLDADALARSNGFGVGPDGAQIDGYTKPGTWTLTTRAKVLNPDGTRYTSKQFATCIKGDPKEDQACLATQNLHFSLTYQPASRYWPFQWIELSAYLGLTLLLSAFGLLWIRHRSSW
jgi:ABC-type transport system involved in multi-copper enzyme maturation permease subunit